MPTPPTVPSWDDNDTNSTEPPQQYQDDGLPEGVPLPFDYLNWILRWLVAWVQWVAATVPFFEVEHDPADGTHTDVHADSIEVAGTSDLIGASRFRGAAVADDELGTRLGSPVADGFVAKAGGLIYSRNTASAESSGTSPDLIDSVVIPAETLRPGTVIRGRAYCQWTTAPPSTSYDFGFLIRFNDGLGTLVALARVDLPWPDPASNGGSVICEWEAVIGEAPSPAAVKVWAFVRGFAARLGGLTTNQAWRQGGNDVAAGPGDSSDEIDTTIDQTFEVLIDDASPGGVTVRRSYIEILAFP